MVTKDPNKKNAIAFLTNDSWIVDGYGRTFDIALKDAERRLRGLKHPAKIIAYDRYDSEGISYFNWKRLPKKKVSR